MSIRSFIVDDENHNIENLSYLLKTHCPEIEVVGASMQVKDAIISIQTLHPELLFLDIRLNQESGFNLLQQLTDYEIEVIFITAYDEYGVQAIKYAALDYLLKPLDSTELILAVQKAIRKLSYKKQNEQLRFLIQELSSSKVKKIALPMQQEIRYVEIDAIIRCEASNNYTQFFLSNGEKILMAKTLKEYADMLPPADFFRTHQSHLVNRHYIKSWLKEDGGILLLTDGTTIPVSRMNRERVKKQLF
ncbi:LytR/AlgR family response regulator transcription factor [Sediminibacterium goheungense]|uniref:LytTR family two component transcriptional regulator n=1 Tax=Sediminibacterium goheungense TaxID=1086393 RepID=A0A4V3C506_9BACT|nr:LytTR family DNA-binding domain-containing protein [Sediminibacterium goheungense]TDO27978.1 LytTR family two component transcriptional regulator [Sediminibacterium goheungense]